MNKGFASLIVIAGISLVLSALTFLGVITQKPDAIFGSGGGTVSTTGISSLGGLTGGTQTLTAGNGLIVITSSGTDHNFQASTSPGFGTVNASSTITFGNISSGVVASVNGVLSATSTIGTNSIFDAYLFNSGDTGTGVYNFSGASSLSLPAAASLTTDADSEAGTDLTSGQFRWFSTAAGTQIITGTSSPAMNIASTTFNHLGVGFGRGTTSLLIKNDPEPITLIGFYCKATSTLSSSISGFLRFGDGTNWTTEGTCNTTG
ncbi:MAG: hypothetical protein AAB456_04210 [Patescibacteria group bacterium]